ncbi:MAG TPA: TIGR04013 family B12-binding domain/radical SAM domain-containing protein [Anaeromyxobacteraceae bacterium]|nr:TIGR04013 family B12-binding domain/radical SAM domain-containing protein [Anaeromyxobacteraceae bacterium]
MAPPTLIVARRRTARFGLYAVAGALEAAPETGAALRVADGREAVLGAARQALDGGGPVLVAWSFYSAGFPEVAAEVAWVRERLHSPRLLHVAGGPHAAAEPEETLQAGFDLAASGEGEATAIDLVRRLAGGDDPRGAPGLAWLGDGALRRSRSPAPVDLDAVPPFAPGLGLFGPVEITRGCGHACRYCQTTFLHGGRMRHRSVEAVAGWVRRLAASGIRDVRFVTPSALAYGSTEGEPRLDRVEALLAAVRAAAGPEARIFLGTFPSEVRPEHLTPEALRLLRRFVANDNLVIGAQSGSDRVLAACRRGHDVEAVRRAVRFTLEAGFAAKVDLMFGLPGERPEDAAATRRLMEELCGLGAEIHAHAFLPLPGTPFAGEPPGRVDAETRRLLDRLASRGQAYGAWRAQEALGVALAGGPGSACGTTGRPS